MSDENPKDLANNFNLGHYRIVRKIGAGGMGEVYLVQDTRLRRHAAIKIIHPKVAADVARFRRFEREAHTASALNHPNILTVYEFGEYEGRHFLATEFVEGKTLRDILSAGRITLDDALRITIQIASALQAAHQAGIVHRDIKPENVMIRDDGYVKVLDFGLAKIADNPPSESFDETRTMLQTNAGVILGTAAYMSPEQARGENLDLRTDIFSLGIVLYELLTLKLPFTGVTVNHMIVSILDDEPPPLSADAFPIPDELKKITLRALAKDREKRYQNTSELIADLKTLRKRLEFEAEFKRTSSLGTAADTITQIFDAEAIGQARSNNAIAVLPFVNMSRDEDGDYFSDGLAEELINVLSKIRGFRVAARTSAFSFKGHQTTISEIGRALNVSSIVEGSVRNAGKRVRISVQMVNAENGFHLWSETYDRTMDDIFAVQDDIARSVVEELRTMLLGTEMGAIANQNISSEVAAAVRGRADNAEAQRLMLLGRHYLDRTTLEDTTRAIKYFRQAVELDEDYALGWAELGRAFSIQAGMNWIPIKEGFDLSRESTQRALELEPNLAEAHAQLGRIQIAYDWDFRGAESSYRKALELAPGSSPVLDGASLLAYKLGNFDEALKMSRELLVHNPLNAAFWHNLGLICHTANLLEEAERAFRKAIELVPQRFVTRALLALVLVDAGRNEEALAMARREPDEFWQNWALAILHHAAGRNKESDQIMSELVKQTDGNAFQIAEVYAMRGETDEAFQWLEQAYLERDAGVTHAKVNSRFRPLHDDPRWTQMLKQIGFDL